MANNGIKALNTDGEFYITGEEIEPGKRALHTKSVVQGVDEDGNRVDLAVDNSGNIKTFNKDFFGNGVVSQIYNQIEVPLDDTNYTDYVTSSSSNGGSASQNYGEVTLQTGTNTNGSFSLISKDFVKYRPNSEIGFGFTWRFGQPTTTGVISRIGCTDNVSTWENSVYFEMNQGVFSLVYNRNGSNIFSVQQSQWIDSCNGSASSKYINLSGNVESLNIYKDQLVRIHCGLFGHAGFVVELLAPNQQWVTIYKYTNINGDTVPVFGNFDLYIGAQVKKTAADSNNYTLSSACWAGWTGSPYQRASVNLTDRSLVSLTKGIITGRSSAGGGTYVDVKVNPSGSLLVESEIVTPVAVTDNGGSLTVDGTISATQSGTWSNRTQDGTGNNITSHSAGSSRGIDVSIIDGSGNQITSFGGGTQYAEDSAHVSGDTLTMAGVVQQSADAALSNDGDRSLLQVDSNGYLKVNVKAGSTSGTQYSDGNARGSATGNLIMVDDGVNIQSVAGTSAGLIKIDLSGTSANSTAIKVDGSSVTQPISGTVAATQSGTWTLGANNGVDIGDITINNAAGASAVNIQDGGNSITVDGSVSITGTHTVDLSTTTLSALESTTVQNGSGASAVNIQDGGNSITVDGTVAATQSGSWSVTLNAGAANIGGVELLDSAGNDLTTTKAVQTTRALSVQKLHDADRTHLNFYALGVAAGTTGTETAITLTKSSNTSATSSASSFVITNGKRFRITHLSFATRGNATATAQTTTFNFRVSTTGAVGTTTTPIVFAARSATPATALAWDRYIVSIPDGYEILGNGTIQFGITAAATYTTNAPTWDVNIMGFEY